MRKFKITYSDKRNVSINNNSTNIKQIGNTF